MEKNSIAIVTDSGASLPENMRTQEYHNGNIVEVPFSIILSKNGRTYRSWVDHSLSDEERREFIDNLNDESITITTSQPNSEDYMKAFDNIIKSGVSEIAVVPMSEALSGSIVSAKLAAEEMKECANITIADCKSVSIAQGLLLAQADYENRQGFFNNANELVSKIEKMSADVHVAQAFSSLEHLRRGGRIGRATSLIGGILNIIPIIGLNSEGSLEPIGKRRGWEKSRRFITENVVEKVGGCAVRLALVHFGSDDDQFEKLKNDVVGRFEIAKDENGIEFEIMECEQSNVISVHAGPGVVGLGALRLRNDI